MTNAKPVTNNEEKAKGKKKKDALEIHLDKLSKLRIEDVELSGADIAAHADALAAAKIALESIKSTVDEAEMILKSAMLRQYCQHYATKGRAPDLRRSIGRMGSCQVVQQNTAKVTTDKAEELRGQGIDLSPHRERTSYTIRMAKISTKDTAKIIAYLKEVLGEDYTNHVSEFVHVGKKFFGQFDDMCKQALGPDEALDEKMLSVLRVLSPTIQLSNFDCDLSPSRGFDLAFEFSQISARKKAAHKEAQKLARQERAEAIRARGH